MTAQEHEIIIYEGEEHGMASEPLNDYLKTLKEKPLLLSNSTACWRGYQGTWELRDKMLFLVKLVAFVGDDEEMGLDYIFPGQKEVFAEWFTGQVRIPQGELLKYVHMEYELIYERDLVLIFGEGVLVDSVNYENIVTGDG